MTEPLVRRHDRDGIATVTLAAPQTLNALSAAMLAALAETLDAIARDATLRVVILAAEGRAFSAGHDLREILALREAGEPALAALFDQCAALMLQLAALPQPVIAQVQGTATAAGCQLACTCDLIVASETARFGVTGINLGLFCATPMVALTRRIAPAAAFELLTTGDFLPAPRALGLGLVNRLAPPDRLAEETLTLAHQIATKDPAAIRLGKAAFRAQAGLTPDQAYPIASQTMVENTLLPATAEAIQSFLTRRSP